MPTLVLGAGDAGARVLCTIAAEKLKGLRMVAVNTHPQNDVDSPLIEKQLIGEVRLGAGGNPILGQRAAEHSADDLYVMLEGVTRLLIVSAFGGGTGTGAAPAIARCATGLGVQTIGVVSLPFIFEGIPRRRVAMQYLPLMRDHTHETVVLDSNDLLQHLSAPRSPSLHEAFGLLDRFMAWHVLARVI
jgi:cell division protein FtsZ